MLRDRHLLALCIILSAASIGQGASAQGCDPRYDWRCQQYYTQPPQPPQPPPFPWIFQPPPRPQQQPYAYPDQGFRPGTGAPADNRDAYGGVAELYAAVGGERFPVPAVRLADIGQQFLRTEVIYRNNEAPGTIIIDPRNHFLYLMEGGGRATRYGVGVGREGFEWSGVATIHDKQEWPDWYPPKEMVQRQPELRRVLGELEGGLGMAGGPGNPLGARALYLWQGNRDTLFRIHGTVEPWTIGKSVSSGCIRMINQDVIDLYQRAPVGAKVMVLAPVG
jgi:lipoprotein-anchoring transpeptidase ErfK/SrfK